MKKIFILLLTGFMILGSSCSSKKDDRIRIIFDTDVGNDVDDVLAMAMLYNYVDDEKVDLLGITISKANEYTVPFVDLLNRYYGHPEIPIGYVYEGKTPEKGKFLQQTLEAEKEGEALFSIEKKPGEDIPEAYKLQRKLLADSPDNSVIFVVVGFHTNIARLLESGPDEYSELTGAELVKKKARLLSVMAGNFKNPDPEYNVRVDAPASQIMFEKWPTDIIVSDLTIGGSILYPPQSIMNDFGDPEAHPVSIAYQHYKEMPYYRQTWDLTSVLQAVEPDSSYFRHSEKGKVTITDTGVTLFEAADEGKHTYLKISRDEIPRVRMALIRRVTGKDEIDPELKREMSVPPGDAYLFFDGMDHRMMANDTDYPRCRPHEEFKIADNILLHHNDDGG